jgi:hypothetical protein
MCTTTNDTHFAMATAFRQAGEMRLCIVTTCEALH